METANRTESHLAPIKILLVDDKVENLYALEQVLNLPGYELVKAQSGKEALKALLEADFAAVLLDIQMPEMDGFRTAKLIRAQERSRHVPIIFVTAIYFESGYVLQGYDAGAVDYIIKPIDTTILKSKIAVFSDLFRQKLEIRKKSEELLQAQFEQIRLESVKSRLFDLIDRLDHSVIWEATFPDMNLTFVSKNAERIFGFPLHIWKNSPDFLLSWVHPDDQTRFKNGILEAASCKDGARWEHRAIDNLGNTLWVHTGIQLEQRSLSHDKPAFRGLSVDITPLKQAEREYHSREMNFMDRTFAGTCGGP